MNNKEENAPISQELTRVLGALCWEQGTETKYIFACTTTPHVEPEWAIPCDILPPCHPLGGPGSSLVSLTSTQDKDSPPLLGSRSQEPAQGWRRAGPVWVLPLRSY